MVISSRQNRRGSLHRVRSKTLSSRWTAMMIPLAVLALLPPLYFHFHLRRFNQMRMRRCGWLTDPPLVCAHGGDSSKAFPNTMAAYHLALDAQVDCIELDVSRSSDGLLFALHDRDLQRISGNSTSRVGHLTHKQIKAMEANRQLLLEYQDLNIPLVEDALKLISPSVRHVILDLKVGPPLYEKGLAEGVLGTVERTGCKNCIVWSKSDKLARDIIKWTPDIMVGYIVMIDPSTGARTNLLRMTGAGVVGVYHPLVDEKLVKILHGRAKKVYAWTVDDEISMQSMLSEGVDAIVTSNPSLLQGLMEDIRRQCLEDGFHLSA